MNTLVGKILKKKTINRPLNILCMPTHERYESALAETRHNFYALRMLDGSIKDWDETYAKLPKNYTLLNPNKGDRQIPEWLDIDLVLSQNKFGQFPIAKHIATHFNLPLISLEHTLPVPQWDMRTLSQFYLMRGDINVFIGDFSRKAWGWEENEARVIHHGVDTNTFSPANVTKEPVILSVVNDWINRDWCCNYSLWKEIAHELPVLPVGKTPGLSKPAKDIDELVGFYNKSQVFVNTSSVSPVPTALLEAMSCGCAVVSSATCMIPEIIENGYNGYCSNDPKELRSYLVRLLKQPDECARLGENARKTILDKFSQDVFIKNWNDVFYEAVNEY